MAFNGQVALLTAFLISDSLKVMSEFAQRTQNGQAALGGKSLAGGKYGYVAAGWRWWSPPRRVPRSS